MVKEKYTPSEIKKIIHGLVKTLTANSITVDKIVLYGSYAKGTPQPHSDIDLAVISPDFKGKKIMEIQTTLAGLLGQYLSITEVIGYSSDEFLSASPETFIGEIKRTGKIIYAS
ncbi:MAG: nucleotidyltransferase domain-containing protein [Desulfatiglans sp.]|jgi:predicted nucleotidyltransferase|nr:nucleotidyltransferase domain-containing protein [Desulfatiglans sp.]